MYFLHIKHCQYLVSLRWSYVFNFSTLYEFCNFLILSLSLHLHNTYYIMANRRGGRRKGGEENDKGESEGKSEGEGEGEGKENVKVK